MPEIRKADIARANGAHYYVISVSYAEHITKPSLRRNKHNIAMTLGSITGVWNKASREERSLTGREFAQNAYTAGLIRTKEIVSEGYFLTRLPNSVFRETERYYSNTASLFSPEMAKRSPDGRLILPYFFTGHPLHSFNVIHDIRRWVSYEIEEESYVYPDMEVLKILPGQLRYWTTEKLQENGNSFSVNGVEVINMRYQTQRELDRLASRRAELLERFCVPLLYRNLDDIKRLRL